MQQSDRRPDPPRAAGGCRHEPTEIVGIGGDLEPGTLLAAYRSGPVPDAVRPAPAGVVLARPAGVIPLDGLVVTRSLRRSLRRYEVRRDTAFADVMLRCADPRRPGSWITGVSCGPTAAASTRLGALVRVRSTSGDALVGGLYGVRIGAFFAGEAMFHHARDASKVALVGSSTGSATGGRLLDVQWVTPHLRRWV